MHRYTPIAQLPSSSANAGPELSLGSPHDREGSVSGSETSYPHYLSDNRDENDYPDDPHLALTSQTLNADGTPKRPMNAFMIFARRRRPQISAANQMMRTGDISKILSKEWNTMDMSNKKFYLDQAKKLKDNFNSKYPDYVYRRRPNNSRKKRKPDSDPHSPTSPGGDTDDGSPEETSPVEGDYIPTDHPPSGYPYPRSQNSSASSDGHDTFIPPHSTTTYSYTSDFSSGSMLQHNLNTLPPPLRMPSMGDAGSNYHLPPSHQPQSPTFSSQGSHNIHGLWDSGRSASRSDQGRAPSSWSVLPALDTAGTRRSSEMTNMSSRSEAFSPQGPLRPWSSSTSSTASNSSGGASGSHYAGSSFPTLTSPFYPAQSPTQRPADTLSSPNNQHNPSQDYFPPNARRMSSGQHSGSQLHGGMTLPSPSPSSYLTPTSTGSQWSPQYSRSSADQQRALTPIQPISTYPLQSPSAGVPSPPSSGSGAQSAQMGYWDRRYDGTR